MDRTKEKIIRAATPLFAARGLGGVTVREICRAAKVNGALVNYHFRNKEGLYRECCARVYAETRGAEMARLVADVHDAPSWEKAVAAWIGAFSDALQATEGLAAYAAGLYRCESIQPSAMQPSLDARFARPARETLFRLMRMATADDREAHLWASSVWMQLAAPTLFAPVWRACHRPADVGERTWNDERTAFVRDLVLKSLSFRSDAS